MLKKLALSLSLFGLTSAAIAMDCTTVTDIPKKECKALVAFYNSTGGDNWFNKKGWLESNMACDWYGVTCSDGHVSKLSLYSNNLTGEIPTKLSNLSKLEYLSLTYNSLSGSIPTELGNLSDLESLNLGGNQLSGSIP
ncbi:MAG: Two component regulator three Y domain protein, partial [Pseudomonadota bacterium]